MKVKEDKLEALELEKENYRQLCQSLYEEGVIKQDINGSIIPVEDPMERESIRTKTKQKMQDDAESNMSHMTQQQEFKQNILDDEEEKMEDLG